MQDVDVAKNALNTEAKLTTGATPPASAPTIDATGVLNVTGAQNVYLNLDKADVASVVREGGDLVLVNSQGETLRLQGFFQGLTDRKLFLEDSDKHIALFDTSAVAADGPLTLTFTPLSDLSPFASLTEGTVAGAVGGTAAVGSGIGAGGAALGGLAALGGIAAAAGGGGGGGGSNSPPTTPADTTPPSAPAAVRFNAAGSVVTGSGEIGATVTIRNATGAVLGTGTVGSDGSFSVTLTQPLINREPVNVVLTDAAGNVSTPTQVVAPDLTAPTAAGNVDVSDNGAFVTGSGEAGATVTVRGPGGAVVGTGVVAADGTFSVAITPLTNGQTVTVVLTDSAGNPSPSVSAIAPDTTAPTIAGNVDVSDNGAAVTGSGEAGATVTVRGPGGAVLGTGVVAADGTFSVTIAPLTNGQTVTVILTDAAGNPSTPAPAVAPDLTNPDAATNVQVSSTGTTVTGAGEVGATVTVRGPDGTTLGTGVVQADGRFVITLPTPLIASETVTVVQADASGNVSLPTTAVAPDLTFPGGAAGADVPTLIIGEAAFGVNAVELSDGIQARVGLTPGAQVGDTVVLTITAGATTSTISHVILAGEITAGVAEVILPATLADGAYSVVAVINDGRGSASSPSTAVTVVVDTTTAIPTIVSANGLALTGTAEAGATIVLLNANGSPLVGGNGSPVTAAVAANGSWSVPGSAIVGGLDGFTGSVRATDIAGNTAQAGIGPVDGSTPAPVVIAQNGLGVQGTAEIGATIALLDSNGAPVLNGAGVPITVVVDGAGAWNIPASALPAGFDGFSGSVRAVDMAGNMASSPVGPIDASITISMLVDPIAVDNVVNGAEAAASSAVVSGSVLGNFTPGETVTVNFSHGIVRFAVVQPNGTWSVTVTGADLAAATSVTASVMVVNGAGNPVMVSDVQAFVVDLGHLAPIVTAANGAGISGTAEAMTTVNLLDAGGTVLATTMVGADGRWTIPASAVSVSLDGFVGSAQGLDPAGNVALAPVGPIDGLTSAPVVTGANGAGLTGTAEAGATVTLVDANGDPVLATNGVAVSVVADANGAWMLPGGGVVGGLNGFTGTVVAVDAVGNAATSAVGPIDGLTPAPVITGANGGGISGLAEPGAIILLDSNGVPVIGTDGQPVRALVAADGTFSIPASAVPGGLNGFTGSVQAVDPAGNASATSVGPINGTVSVTLTVDVVTADNVLNIAESQGSVTLSGRAVGTFSAGQAVTVTLSNGVALGAVLAADGSWSVAANGSDLAGATSITASTTTVDTAGNTVSVSGVRNYGIDLIATAPVIADANGLAVSGTAEAGATVALLNGAGTVIATVTAAFDGAWSFPASVVPGGLDGFGGSVRATDAAGNPASAVLGAIDGSTPVPVIVSANGSALTGTAEAGATIVLLNANGSPVLDGAGNAVTVAVAANGSWSVPGSVVIGGLDGFTGSVRATDQAGNVAQAGVGPVDGTTPAPVITAQNGLGVQGTAEIGATIALLDGNGAPVLNGAGVAITVVVDNAGAWSIPASALPTGLDGFTGSVRAIDIAGNTAASTVGPIDGSITLSLNIDAVTADNVINIAEAGSGSILVTGRALGDYTTGDQVTVTLSNGVVQTGTLAADGSWTVSFAGSSLAASTSLTAVTMTTDSSGNSISVADTQTFAVDVTAPVAPTITAANGVGVSGTGEAGTVLNLLNAGGVVVATTTVASDGSWSIPSSSVPAGLNGFTGSAQSQDAAGNTTSTSLGPIDGLTPAPVVSAANGAALTGSGEAGATITLFTAGGTPLVGTGGATVTAVVNGAGVWTIPGSAIPGGLDGFTGTARAVDLAGNAATGAVGPVDGRTPAPVISAANGSGLFGSAEASATLSLLDAGGNPVLNGSGVAIRVVVAADGSWAIPAGSVPGGLNGFTGSVLATDLVGNTATTAVGPVDGAANLTLVVDPITADNVLSGAEAAQTSVAVTGHAVGDITIGAIVRVELSTGVFANATVGANGVWTATFTGAQLQASTSVTASATATDGSGNSVTVTDAQVYAVDLTTLAPVITAANGTGLSGTAEAGAMITVRNAGGQTVGTTVANGVGVWTLPATGISVNLDGFNGSVQAVDPAGNTAATPIGPVDGALRLALAVSPVTADNVVNIAEAASGAVTVSGSATGEYRAGDTITVTLSNGVNASTVLAANGSWSVAFTGANLAASNGLTASVTTTDAAGNTATITTQQLYGVDIVAPNAPLLTSAGVGGVSGSGEPGSTVQLRDGAGAAIVVAGQPVVALVGQNGLWSIPASAFPAGAVPANFTGQVTAVDVAGNLSAATTIPLIDVTPPSGSTTAVAIDLIAGNDIVNLTESQGSVTVTGLVTGEFRAGDAISVSTGVATYAGSIGADGRWSIVASGAALTGGVLTASVSASDAAGNVGVITGTRPYVLDIQGPGGPGVTQAPVLVIADAADGIVTPAEYADGVSAVVALTPATQVGDVVTLTVTTGGVSQAFTATVTGPILAAGNFTFAIGAALADGQYSATAIIRDPSGNASAPSTTAVFSVDAVPINIGNATAAVSETALGVAATGSLAVTGSTGAVTYALRAPTGSFTSHGQAVTWAIDGTGALIGSAGGQAVVRATVNASGQYSITLLGALDHPAAGADTLQLPIGVSVTDADGTATGVIAVGVADGVPVLAAPTTLTPTAPGVIIGDLVQGFGPDGGNITSVTIDGRTFSYAPATGAVAASGSSTTIVSYGIASGVLSATTVRGENISYNFATGDYRVEVTGQDASIQASVRPDVALGGGNGLLGLINADVLGLIQLDEQQFFSASDANNDISQVVVRYSALVGLGLKTFNYNAALAAELGLTVVQANSFVLGASSQLTITATNGGPVDNLRLNEFLGSIGIAGGLSALLELSVAQSLSIQATDAAGHVTLASESNLANLGVLAGLLGSGQAAQILTGTSGANVITASDVGTGAALDNRLYGYAGNDTLNGGLGNDILRGGSGNDTLNGGAGNDLVIGGTGNDTLNGGAGVDVFRWEVGDQGTIAQPAADVITDFNVASITLGGDVLDLSSLLVGEGRIGNSPGNLANFIHFEQTGSGTLVHISTNGLFVGGYGSATSTGGGGDQTILLSNVNLTSGFGSDQAILADLLARGKLVVDTLAVDGSTASNTLTIGTSVVDGDGDAGSTSVSINSANVVPLPPVPGNVAPVVEANAQTLLGLIGLGALGLDLNSQDLLAADANGNLNSVRVEYAPLVALNLTPLTFAWDAALATTYGLAVNVTQSSGLLGVVAPSARIDVTALNGGVIDNLQINRFLETVHLTDTSGALLSSTLLNVGVLNSLTISATDAQGLSSSASIGSVVSVNLLNSLDGPDPVALFSSMESQQRVADPESNAKSDHTFSTLPLDPDGADTSHALHATPGGSDMITVPAEDTSFGSWSLEGGIEHLTTFDLAAGGFVDTGLSGGSDHALGDGGSALQLSLAMMDEPELNIGQDDRFDTLSQSLQLADAGGYDIYVAPLPILEDTGVAHHP